MTRSPVRFNPTDVGFLEKLTETYEKLDALQEELNAAREKRIAKYTENYTADNKKREPCDSPVNWHYAR